MAYLIDTSILGRLANTRDMVAYNIAADSLWELHRRGESLHLTSQVLIEFRNFATRPVAVNGLGLSVSVVESKASIYESAYPLLHEAPGIFGTWKHIVHTTSVIGKQVHDARLVAVCHVNSITHLLTFNVSHFTRLAAINPGIVVVDPATV
jgi:hypothetical protein